MSPDDLTNYPVFSRAEIVSTMLGLMLGLFLAGLDQTIVATALPYIARDLNAWQSMGWIVTAYLVSSTAATPIYGRLSDLYGRRPVVLVSVAIFIGASVLCALSRTLPELVAARVLQGVGGGGLRSMALVVIADLVPPRERGRYQGYFAGTMTTANALGPILGGFLAQELSWSWIFWINLPVGLVACALSSRHLVRLKIPSRRVAVDWSGAVLTVVAVTVMLIGIDELKKSADWSSPSMIILLGSGIACTAALIWRERLAPQPMLPLHLFNNPIFVAGTAVTSLMSAMIVGLIVVIPLNYQLVLGTFARFDGTSHDPAHVGYCLGITNRGAAGEPDRTLSTLCGDRGCDCGSCLCGDRRNRSRVFALIRCHDDWPPWARMRVSDFSDLGRRAERPPSGGYRRRHGMPASL